MPTKIPRDQRLRYYDQRPNGIITSVGVDYLSVTQPTDSETPHLWEVGHDIVAEEQRRGNKCTAARWKGYDLLRSGSAMVGVRADTVIVQCSAHAAAESWPALLPYARNVTRLDLQVTARLNPARPDLARLAFKHIPDVPLHRGRPRRIRIIANRMGGDTLLLGSRASEVCGRHYDKGVEQGTQEPGYLWRWEVELKGARALFTSISLTSSSDPCIYTTGQVWSWFWTWGLKPGFPRRPQLSNLQHQFQQVTSNPSWNGCAHRCGHLCAFCSTEASVSVPSKPSAFIQERSHDYAGGGHLPGEHRIPSG